MLARTRLLTAVAVALVTVAAPAAQAGTAPDPCVTVGKADAAKALGAPVSWTKPMTAGPSRSCSFHAAAPLQLVVVTAFGWDSPPEAKARFRAMVEQTASAFGAAPVALHGVGDEAVTISSNVYARKGTAGYVFNVSGARTPALTARAVALAKATLARAR
jgi:hypothetical protein